MITLSFLTNQFERVEGFENLRAISPNVMFPLLKNKAVYTPPGRGRVGWSGMARQHSNFVLVTDRPTDQQTDRPT